MIVPRLVSGLLIAATALASLSGCAMTAATATGAAAPPAPTLTVPPLPLKAITAGVPKPRTAPPALATTGTSWPKVLASLSAYGQWLLANPNPALVGNVATPGCPVAQLLAQQVQSLITENAYVTPAPPVFSVVTAPTPAYGHEVLMVTAARPAEPVVSSATGKVTIGSYDAVPSALFEVTLDKGADGKWRYCTIENQPDETVAAVPLI
ncbi:hypothetical protein [Krasilnikovia sp. MM14-A1259]|uniref:hypothetical protein n=1 Tax=Krasilnikovia sp. MM14-A1259 TaxID=3373539 RepID=UPI00399CFB3D